MRIRWTAEAATNLEHIKDYLTEHYPILHGPPYFSFTRLSAR
jgi:hypothetical protein